MDSRSCQHYNNPRVGTVELPAREHSPDHPLAANANVSRLKVSCLDLVLKEQNAEGSIAKLLAFLCQSTTLRHVILEPGTYDGYSDLFHDETSIRGEILKAIARSTSIEAVRCCCLSPPRDLVDFLNSTQTVTKLSLCHLDSIEDHGAQQMLGDAFRENKTLKCLTVERVESTLLKRLLKSLEAHASLEHLTIEHTGIANHSAQSVAEFLTLNFKLRRLKLLQFDFGADEMESFIGAFESNCSIGSLSLSFCRFNSDATKRFARFTRAASRVQEMHLTYNSFENHEVGSMIVKQSIASSLFVLEIRSISTEDIKALASSLPRSRHLKDLMVEVRGEAKAIAEYIVESIRCNGSLHQVKLVSSISGRSILSEDAQRLVDAFCARNKQIPVLLGIPHKDRGTDNNLLLFPRLFVAATQAQETACRNLLIGLLAVDDSCGPCLVNSPQQGC